MPRRAVASPRTDGRFAPLRLASFYTYFAVGLFITLPGPLIPEFREAFGLTHGAVGQMFIAISAGYAGAVLLGGAAADRYDRKRLLVSAFSFLGACFCAFAAAASWNAVLALFVLVGLGFGVGEAVLNALFIDLSRNAPGKGLNALHIAPALGGIAGALFASLLLPLGWRAPLVALGLLLLSGAAWFAGVSYPQQSRGDSIRWAEVRSVAIHPLVLAVAALLTAYVGVEGSLNGWIVTYAIEMLGRSQVAGALVTSAFWLGLAAGRLVCSRIARPDRHVPILVVSTALASAAMLPVLVSPDFATLAFSVLAGGFVLGGVFPTALAHAGAAFPARAGAVTGYLFAWCVVGAAVLPALFGAIADRWGMQAAMASVWAGSLLVTACALALARVTPARRPERGKRRRQGGVRDIGRAG